MQNEFFLAYKQAQRREDDIAIVNSAIRVMFETGSDVIKDIHLVFGGMAPTTVFAHKTASSLVKRCVEYLLIVFNYYTPHFKLYFKSFDNECLIKMCLILHCTK